MSRNAAISNAPTSQGHTDTRILLWVFKRDEETIRCELGLTPDESLYELRIDPPRARTHTVQQFDDAMSAFERQTALERRLVDRGWTLETFESRKLPL